MTTPAVIEAPAATRARAVGRVRAAVAAGGAAVLGAAPHVLHHVGPLAGAALLAGATGKLLFGAVGFALAVPILRRLRRRTRSWRVAAGALAVMAAMYTLSSFVVGPALTGADEPAPRENAPSVPGGVSPDEHRSHHR
jgi:hypothetical protein